MEIRPEKTEESGLFEDMSAIRRVVGNAFGREDEAQLVDRLRQAPEFIPELSLLAELEGRIVGHILLSKVWLRDSQGYLLDVLAVAPVSVESSMQRKGVGGKLLLEALRRARGLGYRGAILLGHPEYYPRFGFERASKYNISLPLEHSDEAFMAMPFYEKAFPSDGGQVIYSASFFVDGELL